MILLYIDPGTGSMLFTILIGVAAALLFAFQTVWLKLKFIIAGGRTKEISNNKIPYLIFSDHKRYWNVFKPICDEFERRKVSLEYWTASPDDPALDANYDYIKSTFIGEGNKAFAKLNLMNVGICLSTTPGLDVYQWKRSKNTDWYVHILHAASDVTMYRMFGLDFYDSILLSGEYQKKDIRKLEKLRNIPEKELVMTGIPYMDAMKKRIKTEIVETNKDLTILLAPTWGPESLFRRFGRRIIDELIKTGFNVIVRPHPQSFVSEKDMLDEMINNYPENRKFEWNTDTDNFNVLRKADVMISDYSGVIFDYSLVYDKPVIYTSSKIDTSVYDAWWMDEPIWTLKTLPKIGAELNESNLSDLKKLISEVLENSKYAEGRDTARAETWVYPGEGAVRVVDYLLSKDLEKDNSKPNDTD